MRREREKGESVCVCVWGGDAEYARARVCE